MAKKSIDDLLTDSLFEEDFKKPKQSSLFDKALGAGEAGLSMVASMPAMIGGGLYGLGTLLSGQGLDKAANAAERFQQGNFGAGAYTPATETGKQYASTLGELFAMPGEKAGDVGAYVGKKLGNEELGRLSAKLPVDVALNFLPLHAAYKGPLALQKALMNKKTISSPVDIEGINQQIKEAKDRQTNKNISEDLQNSAGKNAFNKIVEAELEGWSSPLDPNRPLPKTGIDTIVEQTNAARQRKAQDALEARQRELELSVKRQQQLDFNAAERKRQEIATNPAMNETMFEQGKAEFEQMQAEIAQLQEAQAQAAKQAAAAQTAKETIEAGKRQRAAQEALEQRQQALEAEVKRQAILEQNARLRQQQEQASTGYPQWREEQQMAAEQRQPGNNTPVDFESTPSVSYENGISPGEFPLGQSSARPVGTIVKQGDYPSIPSQKFGAVDPAQMVERAIDEKQAWEQNNANNLLVDTTQRIRDERALAQEANLMGLEETLRKDQYTPPTQEQLREGHLAGRTPRTNGRFGQGGGIDPDLLTLGIPKLISKIKGITQRTPKPDTIETPTTENLINLRYDRRNKAKALGIKGDSYQQITTVEEALAPQNMGKDISARTTQELGAGINGAVRRNPTNGPLKAVRYWMNDASNKANAFLKQYITGDGGFNPTYQKLNEQERTLAHRITQALSESKVEYTPELAADWGLSTNVAAFLEARQKAYKAIKARGDEVNLAKGLEPVEGLDGYFPSMFDRNFVAFVGKYHTDANGVKSFQLELPVAVKSRKEFNDALKLYKDRDIIKLGDQGRTGLRQETGKYKAADDVAFLLNALAETDPRYQSVLDDLKQMQVSRNKSLMNFGVHELEKKGVKGYLGSKPWLDEKTNAKEALEAEIRYFDQAAKYWNSQELLDKSQELVTQLRDKQPETAQYLDKYLNHLTGKHIDAYAAAVNKTVDIGVKYLGKVAAASGIKMAENPRAALAGLGTSMNALMMNVVNVPMFTTQTIQLVSSGLPEGFRVASNEGLSPEKAFTSLGRGMLWRSLAPTLSDPRIASMVKMPEHMRAGYEWMQKHGIDDFNEVMLSQDVLEGKASRMLKSAAFWPTTLPEKLTRPTMFMWMVDMFHQAGYSGEGLYTRAKQSTDYAMTDYRTEEAPLVYDKLGILNPETSALQKFKHNALDQWVSRGGEAKQFPLAFGTLLAMQVALGGLVGMPFMQELDELVIKPLTKKSAREHLENLMGQDNSLIDGIASAYSNMDVGSRFALADVAPGSFGEGIAGARLSKMWKIGEAAYEFGKNLDEASLKALGAEVVPSGVKQAYNQEFYMDEDGFMLNKKGQRKYDVARNAEEQRKALVYGLRPLYEKVQDERDWTGKQRVQKVDDKITAQHQNMMKALNFQDWDGFDKALAEYKKLGGNLAIGRALQKSKDDAMKSERARQQGKPGKSGVSIERFLEFKD